MRPDLILRMHIRRNGPENCRETVCSLLLVVDTTQVDEITQLVFVSDLVSLADLIVRGLPIMGL